jgi:hypothetical protein
MNHAINSDRECDALRFALDLHNSKEDQCKLRLKLARHLQKKTFVGALKIVDEALDLDPDSTEGILLKKQILEAQRLYLQEHKK